MVVEIVVSAQTLIEVDPRGFFRESAFQGRGHVGSYSYYSQTGNFDRTGDFWSEIGELEGFHYCTFFRSKCSSPLPNSEPSVDEEEQEVAVFVRECPCKISCALMTMKNSARVGNASMILDPRNTASITGELVSFTIFCIVLDAEEELSRIQSSPPSPPPYESIYAEPIYGDTASSGGSSSYWTPSSSVYNNETNGNKNYTNNVLFNNTSFRPSSQPVLPTFDLRPDLPPLPSPNPTPSKFSSIAKSAGRKLVKKLEIIRRLSRTTSFEAISTEPLSLPSTSTPSQNNSLYNLSQSSSATNLRPRRVIPRPRIPPPAPPTTIKAPPPPPIPTPMKVATNEEEDFEDSDFCDSDSELIRNFVSAVQPVYSMEEEPLYQYYTYGISLQVNKMRTQRCFR